MDGQISIFDWMPEAVPKEPEPELPKRVPKEYGPEPEVGECVKEHGAIICHIMRPSYIGKKVLIDQSTKSMRAYKCGVLEDYIPYEGHMRSIVYTGEKQRSLITHYPGIEIYECLPWEAYKERMKVIFGKEQSDGGPN